LWNNPQSEYLEEITELECNEGAIHSLKGLENAVNLRRLSFWAGIGGELLLSQYTGESDPDNPDAVIDVPAFHDLSIIENFSKLESLEIGGYGAFTAEQLNAVLSRLSNLEILSISSDLFTDLSAFTGLSGLRELTVQGGGDRAGIVTDISLITTFPNLRYFKLDSYLITDISPLANATNITELDLISNLSGLLVNNIQIESSLVDVDPLSSMVWLQKLSLGSHEASSNINSISALTALTNVEELYLVNLSSDNISLLSSLVKMKRLSLVRMPLISNISAVQNMNNLEYFYLSGIRYGSSSSRSLVSDLSPLSNLTSLEVIHLYHASVSDISPINLLQNLVHVDFTSNNITDISVLANLPVLAYVELVNNDVVDIYSLLSFPENQFQWMYLAGNTNINCTQVDVAYSADREH